jgi:hypothetical protein
MRGEGEGEKTKHDPAKKRGTGGTGRPWSMVKCKKVFIGNENNRPFLFIMNEIIGDSRATRAGKGHAPGTGEF